MAKIAPASRKEETCSKIFLLRKMAGDRASNSGLASAGYPAQPKNTRTTRIFAPFLDLLEEVDSGFGQTLRLLFPQTGVKGSISSIRQQLKVMRVVLGSTPVAPRFFIRRTLSIVCIPRLTDGY